MTTPKYDAPPREDCPLLGILTISGWHGSTAYHVALVGTTSTKYRVEAFTRTRLQGRNRWLDAGSRALVPKTAIRITGGPREVEEMRKHYAKERQS